MAQFSPTAGLVPETWGYTPGTLVLSRRASRVLLNFPCAAEAPYPEYPPPSGCLRQQTRGRASGPGHLTNPARKETHLSSDETNEDRSGLASTLSSLPESPAPCFPTEP